MSELPPDLPRLQVLRDWLARERAQQEVISTYLRLEADRVEAAIAAASTRGDADRYRFQPLRSAKPRTVLHRNDCWVVGGAAVSREEVRIALKDAEIGPATEYCDACHPEVSLQAG